MVNGNSNFSFHTWLGEGSLTENSLVVVDTGLKVWSLWSDLGRNVEMLRNLLSEQLVEKIVHSGIRLREGEDKCIWVSSVDGDFSTKSACQLVRKKGRNLSLAQVVVARFNA